MQIKYVCILTTINWFITTFKANPKEFKPNPGIVKFTGAIKKYVVKKPNIVAKIEDNKIVEKTFIDEPDLISVKDFKIDMINSNYQVSMQIDRDKLYNLLIIILISYLSSCSGFKSVKPSEYGFLNRWT